MIEYSALVHEILCFQLNFLNEAKGSVLLSALILLIIRYLHPRASIMVSVSSGFSLWIQKHESGGKLFLFLL